MGDSKRKSGNGNWLVTYSDLVTLLLVFFVLLYVLTPGIDQSTFNDFISHFQSSTSVIFENEEASKQSDNDTLRKEWHEVNQFLEQEGLSSEVDIEKTEEGVKVTLRDSLTFDSGSAMLLPGARKVLRKIGSTLSREVWNVVVQGHTDNVPIASTSGYRSNWHLGAARAVSVVLFLNKNSRLQPRRFEASSFGEYKPVATNETSGGRRQNRRVEIYVNYKQEEETPLIDFKTKNMNDSLETVTMGH
ncbi:chemotaxis protein MotB [Fodinibius roseus]|uniref:Chemotaxis protein MotB n=1 Tax=Fodinibius roseus TaxID=1194090 RepID=A0A1M5HFR6_9BACT|nr:flagellar motor protein MotB [Fodinibius roseus]SHG14662.1 chemotaxis protein MotB [Fodinibius roseus]